MAIESIVTGDAEAAAPHFVAAAEAADRAVGSVGHPSLGLAGLLPVVGDNIEAAEAVAEASRATAEAGATMVKVARDLGWTDIRIPASTASGALDIEALEAALPAMGSVVTQLREAATALESAGGDGLLGPVASGYRDSVESLSRRADLALRFRDSMQLVTTMFGGERRYLVCVPSLGVSRPGGGAPTAVGVLVVDDGALELEPMTPAAGDLADIDVSLDWPTTARALMGAAEGSEIGAVDGVILIDAGGAPRPRVGDRGCEGERSAPRAVGRDDDVGAGDRPLPGERPTRGGSRPRRSGLPDPARRSSNGVRVSSPSRSPPRPARAADISPCISPDPRNDASSGPSAWTDGPT